MSSPDYGKNKLHNMPKVLLAIWLSYLSSTEVAYCKETSSRQKDVALWSASTQFFSSLPTIDTLLLTNWFGIKTAIEINTRILRTNCHRLLGFYVNNMNITWVIRVKLVMHRQSNQLWVNMCDRKITYLLYDFTSFRDWTRAMMVVINCTLRKPEDQWVL